MRETISALGSLHGRGRPAGGCSGLPASLLTAVATFATYLAKAAALRGTTPSAAKSASHCSGERWGLPGEAALPRGSLAGSCAQPGPTWPRTGTGFSAVIDFTAVGEGEKELRKGMCGRVNNQPGLGEPRTQ